MYLKCLLIWEGSGSLHFKQKCKFGCPMAESVLFVDPKICLTLFSSKRIVVWAVTGKNLWKV